MQIATVTQFASKLTDKGATRISTREHAARCCLEAEMRSSELVVNQFRTDVLMENATDLARAANDIILGE